MKFKKYVEASERFLSGKFHPSKSDPHENGLRSAIEEFIAAAEKLDQYEKHKYYGKALSQEIEKAPVQISIQEFNRSDDSAEKSLHAIIGLATESAELLEAMYKHKWGGEEFDEVNCKEEIGDTFWYLAILFREFKYDLGDVLQINDDKLDKRYGAKFTEESAINRDLTAERKVLEGKK